MNPDSVLARVVWGVLVVGLQPVRWASRARIFNKSALQAAQTAEIITCNHPSLADSLWLILLLRRRVAICGAKPKYFRTLLGRILLGAANIRQVDGRASFKRVAYERLDSKNAILVYPEMGRNPEGLGSFEPWVAEIALERELELQPCWLDGTAPGAVGGPRLLIGERLAPQGTPGELCQQLRERMLGLQAECAR